MRRNSMRYPSLYLVTNRCSLSLEDFFPMIRKAVDNGVNVVQLREKTVSSSEMIEIGKRLRTFLKPLGIPLIINDRIDVAQAVNADGVHLGQSDQNVKEARRVLGRQAIIGLSVETIEQALDAEEANYLGASPVFFSKTKSDCGKPWGLDGLRHLCSISKHPIIAIGGINETNIEAVMECGASGVAATSITNRMAWNFTKF